MRQVLHRDKRRQNYFVAFGVKMKLSERLQNYDNSCSDIPNWCISKLTDLAQELEAMTEWQPIESAPKDGTDVDLWVSFYHSKKLDGYRVPNAYFKDGRWHYDFCDEDYELDTTDCTITHWKPVTKPPQSD